MIHTNTCVFDQEAIDAGGDTEELEYMAKTVRNWTQWQDRMHVYVGTLKRGGRDA